MKIMTIMGTRPEIIRLSEIIKKLDLALGENHIIVHTGQNFDKNLKDVFFEDLNLRQPNYQLSIGNKFSIGNQLTKLSKPFEKIILKEKPDKILILGDTYSALLGIIAKHHGIPIYHMEAGNRSFDKNLPEEVNRKIVDSISTVNMPYTQQSKQNLTNDGYTRNVYVVGNPIGEVLNNIYINLMSEIEIVEENNEVSEGKRPYDLLEGINKQLNTKLEYEKFILVTLHRKENLQNKDNILKFFGILEEIGKKNNLKVVVSVHPSLESKLNIKSELNNNESFVDRMNKTKLWENVIFSKAFGFKDFFILEKTSKLMITDSGTVPEEACILNKPCISVRGSTERQELVEFGTNCTIGNINSKNFKDNLERILNYNLNNLNQETKFYKPFEYIMPTSQIVTNILLGVL